jgi:hypothetical protein
LLEPEGDDAPAVVAIWEAGHDVAGRLLHAAMSRLGGLWIKQGQYLASRADMVPRQMGRHLSSMLDSNPPRPLAEVCTEGDTLRATSGSLAAIGCMMIVME